MKITIYKITNTITNKAYIGQTVNYSGRMPHHKRAKGGCRCLHNSIRKHGWHNFISEVIDECDIIDANKTENKYIILNNTLSPNGYNLVLEKEDSSPRKFSNESSEVRSHALQKREGKKSNRNFLGVSARESGKLFEMKIAKNGIVYGKYYKNEIEAAEAYDRLAILFHGIGARINFIDNINQYLSENLNDFFEKIKIKYKKKSKYNGVFYINKLKKWCSGVVLPNGKRKHLHIWDSEDQAYQDQQEFLRTGIYNKISSKR